MFEYGFPKHWTTLKKLIFLSLFLDGSGEQIVWTTVSGTSPLTLADSMAEEIRSLTQYGKCVQDGTPTPDVPVDIVCNNGALRYGALGRNLLDPSAANTILGYYIAKLTGEIGSSVANFMFAGYIPVTPGTTYVAYGRRKSDANLSDFNRIAWYDRTKTWIAGADYTQNRIAVATAPENAAYARFSCNPSGTTTQTVTQEIVDSYNWTFAEGTAEIIPFEPFVGGVYPDGPSEVLTIGGTNLVDLTAVTDGYYYDQSGVYTAVESARLTDYIPVRAGITYTIEATGAQGSSNVRYNLFSKQREWLSQTYAVVSAGRSITKSIIPAQDGYLRVSANAFGTGAKVDWATLQIVVGEYTLETMPPYQPYVTPQTASVETLLAVGDYADEAEIISGGVKRKVGIKVLDGTENYARRSDYAINFSELGRAYGNGIAGICTHFQCIAGNSTQSPVGTLLFNMSNTYIHFFTEYGGDVAAFKAWLADEYANGTPVIVLYPLATETTEQTTPHALHSYAGTTIVDAQTNVDPVTLEVEYAASA